MSNLSLREIAQSQLDSTPVIDGQLIVCLDTGNAYRDTATAHVKIGSDLEVVSDLPLAPLTEKIYYLKPDKLYVFLGGNWTLLNDKTIDLDESIAKLPVGSSTVLNDDVEIITQDTDITQPHYYRRKLVVLWEYIKTKAQDFFAAKDHKHKKADITDFPISMPASDVYPWAKAATKPSYTKAEVGLGKVDNTADADKTVKRATTAGTADSANYLNFTAGNEINFTKAPNDGHIYIGFRNGQIQEYRFCDGQSHGTLVPITAASFNGKATSAGTADNATNATTASKLSTSAGSTTQPVYFKDGVPVATSYALNKTVPADAKFTDTNTWRPVVNNLTSDVTDQSLSAAQGKVLKDLVDGKLSTTVISAMTDLNTLMTTGVYHSITGNVTNAPESGTCMIFVDWSVLSPFQLYIHDINPVFWKRHYNTSTKTWSAWTKLDAGIADVANSVEWDKVQNKPSTYPPASHNHNIESLTNYATRVYDATVSRTKGTVLAAPQAADGAATFRKLDKNDVGLENVDNTADVNKNVATAKNISISNPILAVGTENSEITGKTNGNKDYTNCTSSVWSIRNALDFRWYDTHWQIGNIRSASTPSAGFGFAYSEDGKSYALKARIDNDGKYIGNLSGTADTSKSLKLLSSTRPTSMNFNLADSDYLGKITYQIASSSTTTGKPPHDCGVLNFSWDNSGWGTQVAVDNNNSPRMYVRGASSSNGASKWDSTWKTVEYKENLGTAAYKNTKSRSNKGSTDWTNNATDDAIVPTMSFMAYWDGAYNSNGASNLSYCDRGRFGTIVTKGSGDYATAGHIHLNGAKTGAIDWNTFTTYGVYKIQNCTMDNARHAPPDEYAFGILQVLDSENNGGEKRIIQIYWPHSTAKGNHLWYRMHNSSNINAGWSGWTQIKKKPDTAGFADRATTSNGVKDYNDGNRTIQIGYAGAGLDTSNLTHIAGYTDNGTKIKDVNKDVLKSWIGLGNYLPLGGGTMSGQIIKSTGGSWIGDRDRAAIRSGYAGDWSYGAVAAMATKNGYWTIGNLGGEERLIFNYSTDSNYSAGKNETSQVYLPAQAGTIITSATIRDQTVNTATYSTYVKDIGNSSNTTFAYSKNGMSYGDYTWLAGWNGYELRAVHKSQFATAEQGVTASGKTGAGIYYVRFGNGTQMCWGFYKESNHSGSTSFPVAFNNSQYSISLTVTVSSNNAPYITGRSTTGFSYARHGSSYNDIQWIAVGTWK